MNEYGSAHEIIRQRVHESVELHRRLLEPTVLETTVRLVDRVVTSLQTGGKVILFGNGGSAADATHVAAEFIGRFAFDRDPMPALSLSDNGSAVTAIGNDFSYELTFARQVKALGLPNDVAIALSTSGSSANVLEGVRVARAQGLFTAAFTGAEGDELAALVDIPITVPSTVTARIQEGYMFLAHIMCELVEESRFGSQPERTRATTAA